MLNVNHECLFVQAIASQNAKSSQRKFLDLINSSENMALLKYLERSVTNQNLIQEEIKRRWNSRLLSKDI
jgi:hypothetical protein